jgi:hypothetical protein
MSSIQIYIPRILGTVKKREIIESFRAMEIGTVSGCDIDMKYKINENNNGYYYAFIKINLFSTVRAKNFKNSVCEFGMIRLVYDEANAQYWEIKHHINKNERNHTKTNSIVPFYRYVTLLERYMIFKKPNQSQLYKPYNMWESSYDLLEERAVDLLC